MIWLVASGGFAVYAAQFGDFEKSYGALSGIVVLMLWLFLTAFAILLGGEINSEMEHQTAVDTTTGDPQPIGERQAVVADEVGADTETLPDGARVAGRPGGRPVPGSGRRVGLRLAVFDMRGQVGQRPLVAGHGQRIDQGAGGRRQADRDLVEGHHGGPVVAVLGQLEGGPSPPEGPGPHLEVAGSNSVGTAPAVGFVRPPDIHPRSGSSVGRAIA